MFPRIVRRAENMERAGMAFNGTDRLTGGT